MGIDRIVDDETKDAMVVDPANPPEWVPWWTIWGKADGIGCCRS
jgi:hypothetical protein